MTKVRPEAGTARPGCAARTFSLAPVVIATLLAGCAAVVEQDGPGYRRVDSDTPDAVPRDEPLSRYGNPESYEVFGKTYYPMKSAQGFVEKGIASWYGSKFHGRKTSSGEIYDMYAMTAAHKQLPLPTWVEVRNLENGATAVVKVNDRGPFHDNRIIDLSYAAATRLGIVDKGTGFVEIRAVSAGDKAGHGRVAGDTAPADTAALYLQIGAFSDRNNARRLAERVRASLPFGVVVREAKVNGRTVYRVQVGPVVSVDNADHIVAALRSVNIFQSHFVGAGR